MWSRADGMSVGGAIFWCSRIAAAPDHRRLIDLHFATAMTSARSFVRRRIGREIADIKHSPQQPGFRQDRPRLRSHMDREGGAMIPRESRRPEPCKPSRYGSDFFLAQCYPCPDIPRELADCTS